MGKKLMAVCGKETAYIKRMYEYILSKYGEDFEVILFTIEESFKDFVIDNPVDVLIAEEGFRIPDTKSIRVKIALSEVPGKENTVFKYMSCDRVLKEIMAVCAAGLTAQNGNFSVGEKNLIGIYTPVKRCFQTTFAITLGQILAKTHKVLYLNFESYSGFDMLAHATGKTDLMDLVYFSECEEENFAMRINSMKEHFGGLDYIFPVRAYTKFSEVSKEQWIKLIDNILSKTEYEYVIMDLTESVNGLLNILEKCNRVYTITDSDRIASAKVIQYENLLRMSSYESILEKTSNISLPRFKDIPSDFEMYSYSELADYIRKMLIAEIEDGRCI